MRRSPIFVPAAQVGRHETANNAILRHALPIARPWHEHRPTAFRQHAPSPADVRLPEGVKKVQVRARGVDRIISPVGHTWDEFFLNGPQASEDFMAERTAQQQAEREAF